MKHYDFHFRLHGIPNGRERFGALYRAEENHRPDRLLLAGAFAARSADDQIVFGQFQIAGQEFQLGTGSQLGVDGFAGIVLHQVHERVPCDAAIFTLHFFQRFRSRQEGKAVIQTDLPVFVLGFFCSFSPTVMMIPSFRNEILWVLLRLWVNL